MSILRLKARISGLFARTSASPLSSLLSVATLLLTLSMLPNTAHAWGIQVDLTGQNDAFVNTSAGAVSDTMSTSGSALRLAFAPDRELAIELFWHSFATDATSNYVPGGDALYRTAEGDVLTLGAAWRFEPRPWFRPFVRGGAGLGTTAVTFSQGSVATGRVTAPALVAAGGMELLIPPGVIARGKDFSIGFLLEFGWMHVFSRPVSLTVDRTTQPKTQPSPLDVGSLGWSAFTTRFGLVIRL